MKDVSSYLAALEAKAGLASQEYHVPSPFVAPATALVPTALFFLVMDSAVPYCLLLCQPFKHSLLVCMVSLPLSGSAAISPADEWLAAVWARAGLSV